MPLYRYEAVDKTGKTVLGAMNVNDEKQLAMRLSNMGYSLKAVHSPGTAQPAPSRAQVAPRAPQTAAASTSAATTVGQQPLPASFPVSVDPSVSLQTLARFYRQLATLIRSGITVAQALTDIIKYESNPKIRRACTVMLQRVQAGDKLSAAMAAYPHLFPVHTVGVIWGGELGGYLDAALDESATELENETKDRRYASIGWWIARLNMVGCILMLPFCKLGIMLETGLNMGMQGSNAAIRAIFSGYAEGFKHTALPALIGWIVFEFMWVRLKRRATSKRVLDAAIVKMPIWGKLHREKALSRFLRTLHRQYDAAVPPAQAWAAASMSVRNSDIASSLRHLDNLLRQPGFTLQQAFVQSGVFKPEDAAMIASGERAGSVPEMIYRLAEDHSGIANTAKNKGKFISIELLILFIIISSGVVSIYAVKDVMGFYQKLIDAATGCIVI